MKSLIVTPCNAQGESIYQQFVEAKTFYEDGSVFGRNFYGDLSETRRAEIIRRTTPLIHFINNNGNKPSYDQARDAIEKGSCAEWCLNYLEVTFPNGIANGKLKGAIQDVAKILTPTQPQSMDRSSDKYKKNN